MEKSSVGEKHDGLALLIYPSNKRPDRAFIHVFLPAMDKLGAGEPNDFGQTFVPPNLKKSIAISVGWGYSCAMLEDRQIQCLGKDF